MNVATTPTTASTLAIEPVMTLLALLGWPARAAAEVGDTVSEPAVAVVEPEAAAALASVGAAPAGGAPDEAAGAADAPALAFSTNAACDFSAVGLTEKTIPAAQWSAGVFCLQ